jgi:hypothetical protein
MPMGHLVKTAILHPVWATMAQHWQIRAFATPHTHQDLPAASIGLVGSHRAPIRPQCRKTNRDMPFERPFCHLHYASTCIVRHAMRFRCFKLVSICCGQSSWMKRDRCGALSPHFGLCITGKSPLFGDVPEAISVNAPCCFVPLASSAPHATRPACGHKSTPQHAT